jgi:hypothetical protein
VDLLPITRPPDYLYTLKSEYDWWTGTLADGRQVLISRWVIYFDQAGRFLSFEEGNHEEPEEETFWRDDLGFVEGPIHIRRFAVPEHGISIQDLPSHMQEFIADPSEDSWNDEEREEYPKCIQEWLESGQYALELPGNEYWMHKTGEVASS